MASGEMPYKMLLLEDNPGDVRLLQELLRDTGSTEFDMEDVSLLSDALARLRDARFDIVLLDLSLPDSQGLDGFRAIREEAPEVPIILLTGLKDEEVALEAVRGGAQDYLIKGEISGHLLLRAIRYAIERKRTQARLEELVCEVRRSHQDLGTGTVESHLPASRSSK
jgi:DNA-binding response OmpR family regulator